MTKSFELLRLLLIGMSLKLYAGLKSIPANNIDTFTRISALRSYKNLGIQRTFELFIHPISTIRYFEFDFVQKNIELSKVHNILDISSPRMFGLYVAKKNPNIKYLMINPDKHDLTETNQFKNSLNLHNLTLDSLDALKLPFKSNSFDIVLSISVIEHIAGVGDMKVIKQIWRVLKPGGKLIITTHVAKKERLEYRDSDTYNLQGKKKKYFFQRIYSGDSLKKRIINAIGIKPKLIEIIGETKKGWFDSYITRWIEYDIKETIFDPWYMLTKFRKYNSIEELPGIGIIAVVFIKPHQHL